MGSIWGRKARPDLKPPEFDGPETLAPNGKLSVKEVDYLKKLAAAGIDLTAQRRVNFMFSYERRAEAEEVIARFEDAGFSGMIVEINAEQGTFMLWRDGHFSLQPGLADWAKPLRAEDSDDVTYLGWVANFPEVSRRASETFFRARAPLSSQ